MSYEPKPGDGILFVNEKKTEKSPDRTGYVIAHRDIKAGEKLNLAGWVKSGRSGQFLSLRMSDMRGREDAAGGKSADDDSDSQIPF